MDITKIVIIGICTAILCGVLKQFKSEYAVYTALVGGMVIFCFAVLTLSGAFEFIKTLLQAAKIPTDNLKILLKALFISYIGEFGANVCADSNEKALAANIELFTKASVLVISIPLFAQILEQTVRLIG